MTEAERRLAEEVVRARIAAEKRDVVARYFLDAAREEYRATRYDAARANLHRVLDLDPSPDIREEAEALRVHVETGGFGTRAVFEQMVARSNVQVQQAISEAHVLLEEGRDRMDRRDFDGAIERFERAEEVLRWLPYESRPVLVQRGGRSLAEADRAVLEAERARALREEARRRAEADR